MSAASELPSFPPAAADAPTAAATRSTQDDASVVRARRQLDAFLAAVVVAFAFLSASFVARNSDLWTHLAAGRLLAQGNYHFGVDPFAYTTEGVYWANHSWLFDLISYSLFQAAGGAALVVFKAVLVAALAGVLLAIRRPGLGLGVPAVCTLLAVLAMSPRLLYQPMCLSFLLLGVTLWLLAVPSANPRRLYALPILFALWANLDAWFLLGPIAAFLYWLGETVQPGIAGVPAESGPGRRRALLVAWAVGLAACVLNPHHVHAFEIPQQLALALSPGPLRQDIRFQYLFFSPWRPGAYLQPNVGWSAAGLAYYVLLAFGLLSFLLNYRGLRVWRVLLFAAFGVLGGLNFRLIPFFAVVAGPVTALNIQDIIAHGAGVTGRPRAELRVSLAALVAGVVLAVLCWPGWLQARPHEARRVGWSVQPNRSLQETAEALAEWHRQGKLRTGGRGFQVHPELADYCTWFCPEEKVFLDHRFELFPAAVIAEFEDVCQALNPVLAREARLDPEADERLWRDVFRKRGIDRIEVYDADLFLLGVARYWGNPGEWAMLYLGGRSLVFGWAATPEAKQEFAALRFDPARLAFGRPPEVQLRTAPPAPGAAPEAPVEVPTWWERFLKPQPLRSWESDAAALYIVYYDTSAALHQARQVQTGWATFAAATFGENAAPVPLPAATARFTSRLRNYFAYLPVLEEGPADALLLAIRAARNALAADPNDINAYLLLGQAYQTLIYRARERAWVPHFRLLGRVRHIQAVTAFEQALKLEPNRDAAEMAHHSLAVLYRDRNCLDAALDHMEVELALVRSRGPRPGEGADNFGQRVQQMERAVEELAKAVRARQNEFTIRGERVGNNPLGRAQLAVALGLARQALDEILLPAQADQFGLEGARMELDLLLLLGRLDRARSEINDEDVRQNKDKFGAVEVSGSGQPNTVRAYRLPAFEWLDFQFGAAAGDYDRSDQAAQVILNQLQAVGRVTRQQYEQTLALGVATDIGQSASAFPTGALLLARLNREALVGLVRGQALDQRLEQADISVLAGLLLLERGLPTTAAGYFQSALDLWEPLRAQGWDFAGRPAAEAYLKQIKAEQSGK